MRIYLNSIGIGVVAAYTVLAQADISASRIRAHVRFLASDLLEGRGVGTRGGQLAEEYLATAMAGFRVQPAGENGTWFQTVPMVGVTTQPDSRVSVVQGGKNISLRWQQDFVATSHRQNPIESFEAEAIFVGHGIVSNTEHWDDYKATDVRGKVVIVFTNEPQPNNPEVFKVRT